MPQTVRKLIGTFLLIVLVPLYALIIAAIAGSRVNDAGVFVQVAFYAFFGLIWVVPAGAIIKWMYAPRANGG